MRRGFATVEFALVLPLMFFLAAASVNYSYLMRTAIAVSDAARAGAEYGSINATNAGNISTIESVALAAAPDVTGLSATAVRTCQCANGAIVNCGGGTCSVDSVRMYVAVTAQTTITPLFSFPTLLFRGTSVATATMRAQ